jgi:hypothetical protein
VDDLGLGGDSGAYLELLAHAKVVVTANPSAWEGDHRTWEALAAGALVPQRTRLAAPFVSLLLASTASPSPSLFFFPAFSSSIFFLFACVFFIFFSIFNYSRRLVTLQYSS